MPGYTLFDTAIGTCGIAWGEHGICGVQLPEADAERTRARLRRRFGDIEEAAPPPAVAQARAGIIALLQHGAGDLTGFALDQQRILPFNRRVYAIARGIAAGHTLTYGEVAARLGESPDADALGQPSLPQAVGLALGQNPFPLIVPCHRVLAAGGKLGGFSANGGVATKQRLLEIEGALPPAPPAAPATLPLFDD
jgi:methylated-DNA-[protein]-cysteine S-methyltransferase